MYTDWIRPLLFRLPSDRAHDLALSVGSKLSRHSAGLRRLDAGIGSFIHREAHEACSRFPNPLAVRVMGLDFRNPIGLAAGFDKNARIVPLIDLLGFGHSEIGSITARASRGNPLPRSFRLPEDGSLINRMGLNNDGADAIIARLRRLKETEGAEWLRRPFPIGVNIAKTHDPSILGEAAIRDYEHSFHLARDVADYITLNISCPNTTEGKTFEEPDALSALLVRLLGQAGDRPDSPAHPFPSETESVNASKPALRHASPGIHRPPILVKFSPDLDHGLLLELLSITEANGIDGYVATNTSSLRDGLRTEGNQLALIGRGGLSGRAIRSKSLITIERIAERIAGGKPIIGVGGVSSADHVLDAMKAGASLVQLYTGLIYEGPFLARRLSDDLLGRLRRRNLGSLAELVSAPV